MARQSPRAAASASPTPSPASWSRRNKRGRIAAMTTPGTSAAGLLDAIGRLADVIERENAALAAGGREAVRPLLEEKRTACRAYEEAVRELSELAGTDDV